MISIGELTWKGIEDLSASLHHEDHIEVTIGGDPPRFALAYGLMFGWSRAAYRDDQCIGAWGYTNGGVIWSLWAPLTRRESVRILRETPKRVAEMLKRSGLPRLHNYVHVENKRALKWLQHSGCFDIDTCNPRLIGQREQFYHFDTKEVPRV